MRISDWSSDVCSSDLTVLGPNGKPFTPASIGPAIATRAIMADLRAGMDGRVGGPPHFSKADRSQYLQALDTALAQLKRQAYNYFVSFQDFMEFLSASDGP